MYESSNSYHLYCTSKGCLDSIFGRINATELALTIDNLVSSHHCQVCGQLLVSSMEIELEQVLSSAGVKSPDKSDYTSY